MHQSEGDYLESCLRESPEKQNKSHQCQGSNFLHPRQENRRSIDQNKHHDHDFQYPIISVL